MKASSLGLIKHILLNLVSACAKSVEGLWEWYYKKNTGSTGKRILLSVWIDFYWELAEYFMLAGYGSESCTKECKIGSTGNITDFYFRFSLDLLRF